MLVPNSFKDNIAKTFYDKDINILSTTQTVDAEGGRNKGIGEVVRTFKGNVNFSVSREVQEEYGLDYQIDLVITTDDNDVDIGDIIKYLDVIYTVTDAKPRDSHRRLVASIYDR